MRMYGWHIDSTSSIIKSRVHMWFDTERHTPRYGVQVKTDKQKHPFFQHVFDERGVILFDTHKEAEIYRQCLFAEKGKS